MPMTLNALRMPKAGIVATPSPVRPAVPVLNARRATIAVRAGPEAQAPEQQAQAAPSQEQPPQQPEQPPQPQGPLSPAEQEKRATQAVMQARKPEVGTKEFDSNSILNSINEAINGRAAMMGFLFAVIGELSTNHGVVSQVAGRYEDQELVEKAIAGSDLGFGAVVVLTTLGTVMPRLIAGENPGERSFGPFTPGLEKTLGRVAMLGFAGLLIVEDIMGHPLL